jgi:hypothetical protein
MNPGEFELQGQMHTQAALESLRLYMTTPEGRAKMYQLSDRCARPPPLVCIRCDS